MTDHELAETMDALACQFIDAVRLLVPEGQEADQWEDAFRAAFDNPHSQPLRDRCDFALSQAYGHDPF